MLGALYLGGVMTVNRITKAEVRFAILNKYLWSPQWRKIGSEH